MNGRLWACVLAGVIVAHLALLYIVGHIRAINRPAPTKIEPNFESRTVTVVNREGRMVSEVSEFTVITKLANGTTQAKPPAPDAAAAR